MAALALVAGSTSLVSAAGPADAALSALPRATATPGFTADIARLAPTDSYEAFVHVAPGTSGWEQRFAARNITVEAWYSSIDAYFVRGSVGDIASFASVPGVVHLEDHYEVDQLGDTASWATRVEVVRNAVEGGPYTTPSGAPLDGTGVGVAVVDSGVDGSHPDLDLASNWTVQASSVALSAGPGANTDLHSGHGTHVSGIVAGTGAASEGTYRGVAPKARLHGYATGFVITASYVSRALDHLYNNRDTLFPDVEVINISAGNPGGTAYNPNGAVEKAVNRLITDKGITVVVAAGNDGGDGSTDTTSGWCKNPTAGMICVANYHDQNDGSRTGTAYEGSSRGAKTDQTTWVDIAAPGSSIVSTCSTASGVLCDSVGFVTPNIGWAPWYGSAYGTSMASPHVAGIVALMMQANPGISPAQVEATLKSTAQKVGAGTDGFVADTSGQPDATGTHHHAMGAGLVDAAAATAAVGAVSVDAAPATVLASGDVGDEDVGSLDVVSASVATSGTNVVYRVTVRDAADVVPGVVASYRILQNVAGAQRWVNWRLSPTSGPSPSAPEAPDDPGTAEPTTVTLEGNTFVVTVSKAELGLTGPGTGHNVQVGSYLGAIRDVMPSPATRNVEPANLLLFPKYGAPYEID